MNEDAVMEYEPDDDKQNHASGIQVALTKVRDQLLSQPGVKGVGSTKSPEGVDVVVVYVENAQVISLLPSELDGYSVVGEVTGDINAY